MDNIMNQLLEGKSVREVIINESENEYTKISKAFKNIYSFANMNYAVGDLESPDEKHDRFSINASGARYFWVEINYETGYVTLYCHPNNYKCVGSREKFNITASIPYKTDDFIKTAISVYCAALNTFTV